MWCVVWLRMCVDGEGGSEARARQRERTGGINTNTLSLVRLLKMTVQHVTNPHTSHPTRIPLTLAAIFSHINGKFNSMNVWKIWSRGRVEVGASPPNVGVKLVALPRLCFVWRQQGSRNRRVRDGALYVAGRLGL